MEKMLYERFNSDNVTDEMLEEASKLFSEIMGFGVSKRRSWWESLRKRVGLPTPKAAPVN
jgi:hypothetical protein